MEEVTIGDDGFGSTVYHLQTGQKAGQLTGIIVPGGYHGNIQRITILFAAI
jgi:hypothetical protein